jgi:DNA replication protein
MKKFNGFTDQETFTQVPDSFFQHLLAEIEDTGELKVTLYVLWRIEHMEGRFRSLCRSEMLEDRAFVDGIGEAGLASSLEKAVARGSLLKIENNEGGFYFLNSPRGRAAVEAMQKGDWRAAARPASTPPVERPNIFKLYEENIGPLTPLLADALKDAEQTYPPEWIAEALGEAVKNNKRNWKYVEAILRRWKEEGHAKEQDRRDAKEPRGRDVTRKVEDFFKR